MGKSAVPSNYLESSFHMRRLVYSLFLMVFIAFPALAEGWPLSKGGDPRGLTRELKGGLADNAFRLIDNLPWLPDGKEGDKVLYVIYTPTCPFSQKLYDATRKLTDKVQIRWIPVDPDGSLNSMYVHRDPETVRRAFKSSQIPPDGDKTKTANINAYTAAGISYMLLARILSPDGNVYFPTLIYGTPEKISLSIGPVENISNIIEGLPSTQPTQQPEATTLGAIDPPVIIPTSETIYVNKSKARVALHLVADENSNEIGAILPGVRWPLPIQGITKDGFVVFQVSPKGASIFIYDPEFVQSASRK